MSNKLKELSSRLEELIKTRDTLHEIMFSHTGNAYTISKDSKVIDIPQGTSYYAKVTKALMEIDQEILDFEIDAVIKDLNQFRLD